MLSLVRAGLRFALLRVCLGAAPALLLPTVLPAQTGALLRPAKYAGSAKVTQTEPNGRQQFGSGSLELTVVSVSSTGEVVASMIASNGLNGGGDLRGTVGADGTLRLSGTVAMRPTTLEARVSAAGAVVGRYSLGDAWPRVDGEFSLMCSSCPVAAAAGGAPGGSPSAPPAPAAPRNSPPPPTVPAAPATKTDGLVGAWSLSLPGAVSITDSRQRVDSRTVEKTSKVTITTSQAGMGSLTISANGSYRLVWDSKTTTGRWDRSPAGAPFPGSIRLLDAHPHKHWDDRNWYVFVKDDGEKEARFPPHTGYDAVRLRPGR